MNIELVEAAKARIPSVPVLVNMVSKRVRQLNSGERPLVKPNVGEEKADIALREIAEDKLGFEFLEAEEPQEAGIL